MWQNSGCSATVGGAAVAFGTNDTVTAVTYTGGASTALVTVTNFFSATDTVFYAGRATANADAGIIASAASSGGNTTITLPDGTTMMFAGLASPATLKFTA